MKREKTLFIARSAVVCALYVALTYACAPLAYGPLQIRIGEGLTMLPLLYPETIPALFLGCALANIASPFGIADVLIGSFTTLIAAILTYIIGKKVKNVPLKLILGGLPPVVLNAAFLPLMWLLLDFDLYYAMNFLSILLTQSIFVYAIGVPLYIAFDKLVKKGVKGFQIIDPFVNIKKKNKNTGSSDDNVISEGAEVKE